jgi:hypothetical protein
MVGYPTHQHITQLSIRERATLTMRVWTLNGVVNINNYHLLSIYVQNSRSAINTHHPKSWIQSMHTLHILKGKIKGQRTLHCHTRWFTTIMCNLTNYTFLATAKKNQHVPHVTHEEAERQQPGCSTSLSSGVR